MLQNTIYCLICYLLQIGDLAIFMWNRWRDRTF